MKYYIVSDVHGYYTELWQALQESSFFEDVEPHKLIICGDLLDRGAEALEMEDFLYQLFEKDELICIRGNHEDLMEDMIDNFPLYTQQIRAGKVHHVSNGTFDSALQLSGLKEPDVWNNPLLFVEEVRKSLFWRVLLPAAVDYFETEHYVFVHGWIPCKIERKFFGIVEEYIYDSEWRRASEASWECARWLNGMKMAIKYHITEPGKTIVCGHVNTSYGHQRFGKARSQWGRKAEFSTFYGAGIIALDGCVAYSGRINCIVLDD